MVALLDLHWTASGSTLATKQRALPDRDHANDFWKQAAAAFKDDLLVVYELFNEPFPAWGAWTACGGRPGRLSWLGRPTFPRPLPLST
eukprot:gene3397-16521_t